MDNVRGGSTLAILIRAEGQPTMSESLNARFFSYRAEGQRTMSEVARRAIIFSLS